MQHQHTLGTVEALRRATSIEMLATTFATAALQIGMSASASGMVSGPRALSANIFHFTNWPPAWLALYREENFSSADPVARWALISGEAVSWSSVINRLASTDPGLRVYRAAKLQGFFEGFVTPVRARDGSLGLVSVGGGARPDFTAEETLFIQSISAAAFLKGEELLGAPVSKLDPLTQREQEVVALLRQGFTDPEIARVIGLSPATVRFHLENARRKTNSRNRVDLAMRSVAIRAD